MILYDVMYNFISGLFPAHILNTYYELFELPALGMTLFVVYSLILKPLYLIATYILIFSIIIIPLYRVATYFLKAGKR